MNRLIPWGALLVLLLAACGGPPQADPTPLPAAAVRPEQPTPAYPSRVGPFMLATPLATPVFVTATPAPVDPAALSAVDTGRADWIAQLAIEQLPSAVGIATGGAAIYDAPGGRLLKSVPSTGVLNVTGVSADGRWLSVYDETGVFGWVQSGQLVLFGDDDLTIVDEAADPGVVATLIADVMQPVEVLDDLMATLEAAPTPATTP